MNKSTPRPWRIDPVVNTLVVGTKDPMPIICDTEAASHHDVEIDAVNAAYIVKCVNMHDEMIGVFREIRRRLEDTSMAQNHGIPYLVKGILEMNEWPDGVTPPKEEEGK